MFGRRTTKLESTWRKLGGGGRIIWWRSGRASAKIIFSRSGARVFPMEVSPNSSFLLILPNPRGNREKVQRCFALTSFIHRISPRLPVDSGFPCILRSPLSLSGLHQMEFGNVPTLHMMCDEILTHGIVNVVEQEHVYYRVMGNDK
ncbi:uncharacterized protein [Primulina eburnea]|uniref:uncharacterized protein isoform X2 n=1 Tax=Primulina eburnea TaxID=1245227 RepID=UPI003C6C3331